jgi:hypothetical protein
MTKVLMVFLAVLVMASTAFAAYLANDPCQTTQRVESHGQVASSVKPDQRLASLTAVDVSSPSEEKIVLATGIVSSTDPAKCPVSYFGAQDARRSTSTESGGNSGSGDSGAASD